MCLCLVVFQNEQIQALLHDYLIDEQHPSSKGGRSAILSINDALRQGKPLRDANRTLFKFGESDVQSANRQLKPYEDTLNRSLKQSVPGLVSSLAEGTTTTTTSSSTSFGNLSSIANNNNTTSSSNSVFTLSSNDSVLGGGHDKRNALVGRTHRMLVPPNSFFVDSLVLPTMRFLERARSTLPEGFSGIVNGLGTSSSSAGDIGGVTDFGADLTRRYSGIMDAETLDRLGPALNEWRQRNDRENSNAATTSSNSNATNANGNAPAIVSSSGGG